ncbi:MAG: 2,3-bisphosphoglycerate-independent phosphoglycerate mutase [Patescibacteria group bacterium]
MIKPTEKNTVPSKHPHIPVVLIIIDGWGIAPPSHCNAVTLAHTPNFEKFQTYPHTQLQASSKYVGLPVGQDGNSEAGHMNIGAGRIVDQDAVVISKSINDGTFFKNPAFHEAIGHAERNKSALHIMGLLSSNQSGHSDPDHLLALITMAQASKVKKVYLHLFTDGRDSPQFASIGLLRELDKLLQKMNNIKIASIMGRFYAMDRKKKWSRTERAYNALVMGEGLKKNSGDEAVVGAYSRGESDEFIQPTVLQEKNRPAGLISDNDSIIFFNLRSDRARQLAKAFVQTDFVGFKRQRVLKNLRFIAMTDFGPDLDHILTAYPSVDLKDTLPVALKNFRQLYIAESEKYAHVTYFFNGGYADPVAHEDRIMIPSPDVANYADKPEMSARQITQVVVDNVNLSVYDFICINFANPDMIGHTGNIKASTLAIETVDECVGQIYRSVMAKNGVMFITGDHGNAEDMINETTGEVNTEHSLNPVPLYIISNRFQKLKLRKEGVLGDVAPTILDLFRINVPAAMTGHKLTMFPKGLYG